MEYMDYTFDIGDDGLCKKYTGKNALILAVRNILLSRPGNYPFTPSLGMDIGKYQFELFDDATLSSIKTELSRQIAKYVPAIDNVEISVSKVEQERDGKPITALGISVSALADGSNTTSNFLVLKDKTEVRIYNETN